MKATVAIYARVSTKGQELENQLHQLRNFCKKSEWQIYHEYTDVISGREKSRPKYNQLFQDAHKKLFDGVLFWSLDRFSRSGTLFTLQKLKELDNLGIFWHSYQDQYISTAGEWKDVIISIMATLAKVESQRISERTKAALEIAKNDGVLIGRAPLQQETIDEVLNILKQPKPPSYAEISRIVTYKIGHKKYHISPASITKIKKLHLKKGGA